MTDAARGILSAMMLGKQAIALGVRALRPDAFTGPHAKMLASIIALDARSEQVDLVTLVAEMERAGTLKAVGGVAFVASCCDAACPVSHVESYAAALNRAAEARSFRVAIAQAQVDVAEAKDVGEHIDRLMAAVVNIRRGNSRPLTRSFAEIHADPEQFVAQGISWGFGEVDKLTRGFRPGEMTVIGARTGMGKTALACSVAATAARLGHRVLMFSLEMTEYEILDRVAALCGATSEQVLTRTPNASDPGNIARKNAARLPIRVNSTSAMTVMDMRAEFLLESLPPELVIVDYLQKVRPAQRSNDRQREVSESAQGLKHMAKEFRVPVLALAQLNRAVEEDMGKMQKPRRPVMSDLRESDAIAQEADVVGLMHRPGFYLDRNDSATEILFPKIRNKWRGLANLTFDNNHATFVDRQVADYSRDWEPVAASNGDGPRQHVDF